MSWLKLKTSDNPQAGFTLLETLIALAIMLVAFTAILSVESASITATDRAKQMNVVAMLAKNRMVTLEYEFEGKTFDEFKKEDAGTFEEPFQAYRWKSSVKEIKFPTFDVSGGRGKTEGSDAGSGGGEGENTDMTSYLVKLVTNFLSKAIREVTVTITWTRGSGEQNFSVSTYWVNLNHEFAISE
ncbi:MAG TPA: hypothetical protein DCS07_06545 [Bdellovibrionales bacterium]|nr:MAG: hypothetical protein A2Z97_13520 [Bdellovibrionales bacterium GWB1_52_6]OFZ06080.1 MAG: hypothetical protein A2X97_01965 [Bdellovibrionales bacterium GWA1_52_35]OFZ34169.1 MAG: hypothetical protein A2070_01760 [Bdellovibrionales bacterium GWC1_52_8]HAR42276.1 hypothetical protein [Bdellovibrionales bacterium]HCM39293.1 hypothetical protein [Bdellovibrionales bacterium]